MFHNALQYGLQGTDSIAFVDSRIVVVQLLSNKSFCLTFNQIIQERSHNDVTATLESISSSLQEILNVSVLSLSALVYIYLLLTEIASKSRSLINPGFQIVETIKLFLIFVSNIIILNMIPCFCNVWYNLYDVEFPFCLIHRRHLRFVNSVYFAFFFLLFWSQQVTYVNPKSQILVPYLLLIIGFKQGRSIVIRN